MTADQSIPTKAEQAAETRYMLKERLKLIEDLWWFIENVTDEDQTRTNQFFKLRERVRTIG